MATGLQQGIIFSDLFITNKDMFVQVFSSYYQEKQSTIDPVILGLQNVLQKYTTKQITPEMADEFKIA